MITELPARIVLLKVLIMYRAYERLLFRDIQLLE